MDFKDLNQYPSEWATATFYDQERGHTVLRINTGISEVAGHPMYPVRVGVSVALDSELVKDVILYELENSISAQLEKDVKGVIVMSLTGMEEPMFRELVCYSAPDMDFASFHKSLRDSFQRLDVQMYAENDPEWALYRMYRDPLKN